MKKKCFWNFYIILGFLGLVNGINSPQKTRYLANTHYKLVPYFAKSYVKKYFLKKDEQEELIQYGYQGFMRACQKYDEKNGAKISTYSSYWIRKYMDDYIKDKFKKEQLVYLDNILINNLLFESKTFILDDYNLDSWEKELLIRKYLYRETFKNISLELNISKNMMTHIYSQIFEKIRIQDYKLNE